MEAKERIKQVTNTIDATIQRIVQEYNITYAELLGILESLKLDYYEESRCQEDEGTEEGQNNEEL